MSRYGPGRILLLALALGAAPPTVRAAQAAARAAVGGIDAVAAGPSVATRLAEIRRRIQAALVYPPLARARGLTGVTRVQFEIERDGHPSTVRVARTSGSRLLDRAAARAVREAGRLPWVYGWLEVPVRFELTR